MDYKQAIALFVPTCRQEEQDKQVMLDYIRRFAGTVLTRDNQVAHLTSSGFVVNPAATKTLMVHHNIYNAWCWTGGHADGNGDLLAVALREACEETGVADIRPLYPGMLSLDILPVWGHWKRGKYVSAHLHLSAAYVLVADEAAPLRACPGENSGVRWIGLDELETCCNEPQMLPVYQKLADRARSLVGGAPPP